MKIKLPRPFSFEGKEYTEIDADLDGLTGKDISEVKRRWAALGNSTTTPIALDPDFDVLVLQKASKLPYEFFEQLPAGVWLYVAQATGNFLAEQGWG